MRYYHTAMIENKTDRDLKNRISNNIVGLCKSANTMIMKIFQFAREKKTNSNISFVCKSWGGLPA